MTANRINKLFQKATSKALVGWETDLETTELINELWVWYLESNYIQKKLDELSDGEAVKYARRQAINILTREVKDRDVFQGRGLYSSDSVREALRGGMKNHYLLDILPLAFTALTKQNAGYAEELRLRYTDGVVPAVHSAQEKRLSRAVKSLTEHVNIIALTAGVGSNGKTNEGPGSRSAVFPDTRRQKNAGHPDPVGDMAIMLINHPELRDEYLQESPLSDFLKGKG